MVARDTTRRQDPLLVVTKCAKHNSRQSEQLLHAGALIYRAPAVQMMNSWPEDRRPVARLMLARARARTCERAATRATTCSSHRPRPSRRRPLEILPGARTARCRVCEIGRTLDLSLSLCEVPRSKRSLGTTSVGMRNGQLAACCCICNTLQTFAPRSLVHKLGFMLRSVVAITNCCCCCCWRVALSSLL